MTLHMIIRFSTELKASREMQFLELRNNVCCRGRYGKTFIQDDIIIELQPEATKIL